MDFKNYIVVYVHELVSLESLMKDMHYTVKSSQSYKMLTGKCRTEVWTAFLARGHTNPPPATPAFYMDASSRPGYSPSNPSPCLSPRKTDDAGPGPWTPALKWETWKKLLAHDFGCAQFLKK